MAALFCDFAVKTSVSPFGSPLVGPDAPSHDGSVEAMVHEPDAYTVMLPLLAFADASVTDVALTSNSRLLDWLTHTVAVLFPQVNVTRPPLSAPVFCDAEMFITMPLPALPEDCDNVIHDSDFDAVQVPVAASVTDCAVPTADRLTVDGVTLIFCDAAPACTMVADAVMPLPLVVVNVSGIVTGSVDSLAGNVTTTVPEPLPVDGEMVTFGADVWTRQDVDDSTLNSCRVSAAIMLIVPNGVTRI